MLIWPLVMSHRLVIYVYKWNLILNKFCTQNRKTNLIVQERIILIIWTFRTAFSKNAESVE